MQEYLDKVAVAQRGYKSVVSRANHLKPFFGNKPLPKISPDEVIEYKFSRQAEVKSRAERLQSKKGVKVNLSNVIYSSINRELALLRRLYYWYRKQKRQKIDNPVEGIEFYRETSRTRIMTEEEEPRFFIEGKAPQHVKDIVAIGLSTGMRLREILNLKRDEVLLGDIGGTIVLRDTKNGESRKIPLTKELTDLFSRIIDSIWDNSPYLFCNRKTGRPITDIKTSFTKCCRRANIENLRFHDLRHTFCTRLANEGVNPFIIMQIVGHKDTKTAKRYTNPTDEHLMAAMAKIGKKSHQFSQQLPDEQEAIEQDAVNTKQIPQITKRAISSVG